MSNPGDTDATPLTSVRQMADYLAAGCKPPAQFRIGTEHEKFGFRGRDFSPPPYLPADGQPGCIRDLLRRVEPSWAASPSWTATIAIGLKQGGASISLEPAGQLELSGAPVETLHETAREMRDHFEQVRAVSQKPEHGVRAARLSSDGDARSDALDAQGALRHHAALHAAGRRHGPGHDEADLHRAGQPGLRVRGGHAPQATGVAAVAAPGDSPVREFALYRGQAERVPVLPGACLDRYGQSAGRHPKGDVRGRFRV